MGDYAGSRAQQGSKSEMGLQSLGQGNQERAWNGEGRGGSGRVGHTVFQKQNSGFVDRMYTQ